MRRRWVIYAAGALLGLGIGAVLLFVPLRTSERAASRAATDRPCERPYVVPPAEEISGRLALDSIATLEQPTAVAVDPTEPDRILIGLRTGRVVAFADNGRDRVVLDLEDDTASEGDGGLLGVTYSPDGAWVYVYRTRADNTERITVYPTRDGAPVPGRERVVLDIPHPDSPQHHGGALAFGPDGYLYIGTGDGGGLGDPRRNGQRLSTLLGKLLRIDPTPDADEPYRVPDENPFVGDDGRRPEIYAYGLRNPYRIAFDPTTDELWIADVGQSCWEEIDVVPAGGDGGWNFGWDRREGAHRFQGDPLPDDVSPLHEVSHQEGWCAIVGGYVYRGEVLDELEGVYLFTDYCRGVILGLRREPDGGVRLVLTGLRTERPVALVPGPDGEPWVLSLEGAVSRIVPAGP